jgi:hypothetical protein
MIPDRRRYNMGQESALSMPMEITCLTQVATLHTFPPLLSIAPRRLLIDTNFLREQNYWLSYRNIKQACYNVLDETIDNAFKFSPDPNLTGWNPSMEIIEIMERMTTTYERPTPTALLQNAMHPRSSFVELRIVKKS